jgi:hypothetical protein
MRFSFSVPKRGNTMNLNTFSKPSGQLLGRALGVLILAIALWAMAHVIVRQLNVSAWDTVRNAGMTAGMWTLFLAKYLSTVLQNDSRTLQEHLEMRRLRYLWGIPMWFICMVFLLVGSSNGGMLELAKFMLPAGHDPAESYLYLGLAILGCVTFALTVFLPTYLLTTWREDELVEELMAAKVIIDARKPTD